MLRSGIGRRPLGGNGAEAWPCVPGAEPHAMPGAVTEAYPLHCASACLHSSFCVALLNIRWNTSAIRARAQVAEGVSQHRLHCFGLVRSLCGSNASVRGSYIICPLLSSDGSDALGIIHAEVVAVALNACAWASSQPSRRFRGRVVPHLHVACDWTLIAGLHVAYV